MYTNHQVLYIVSVCVWVHLFVYKIAIINTYIQKNHSENCNIRLYLSSSDNQKRLALLNCSAIYFIADKSEINDMERMNSQPKKNSPARQVAHIILHNHTCNGICVRKPEKKEHKHRRNFSKRHSTHKTFYLQKYKTTKQIWWHGCAEENEPVKCEIYTQSHAKKVILLSPGCVYFHFP